MADFVPSPVAPSTSPANGLAYQADQSGMRGQVLSQIPDALRAFGKDAAQVSAYFNEKAQATNRVAVIRGYSDFQLKVDKKMADLAAKAPLGDTGYTDHALSEYDAMEKDYLATVPTEFANEVAGMTANLKLNVGASAIKTQAGLSDAFFQKAVGDQYQQSSSVLANDPSIGNLTIQRGLVDAVINSSGLTSVDKETKRRAAYEGLEKIVYRQAWQDQFMAEATGQAGAVPIGMGLIQNFDGGTDEEAHKVATAAEWAAVSAVGGAQWAQLPARVRGALISTVADLNHLPKSVVEAVQSGDVREIAKAVQELGGERRADEAARILNVEDQSAIDQNAAFINITYEDRVALRRDAENQTNSAINEQNRIQTAQVAAQVDGLKTSLFDGKAGMADIEQARQEGWLTKEADIAEAHAIYDKVNKDVALSATAMQKLAAGQTFDPTSTDDKNALNALVGKSGVQALVGLDSQWAASFLLPVVRTAQDIPTDVAGALGGMIRSTDQKTSIWALDLLSQLQSVAPDAFHQRLDTKTESDVNFYRTRRGFMQDDDLLKAINRGTSSEELSQENTLRAQARDMLTNPKFAGGSSEQLVNITALHNKLQESFGKNGFLGFGGPSALPALPWVQTAMFSDFNNLFEDEFVKYGNASQAQDAAIADLQRVWGVTNTGGSPNIMRYPPEHYFPQMGGSYDWMNEQVKESGLLTEGETFQMVSDAQTKMEIERGMPPSYVFVRVKDGVARTVQGMDGYPRRQTFSVGDAEMAKERAFKKAQAANLALQDTARSINLAGDHSVNTGVPVPAEAYGVRDPLSIFHAPGGAGPAPLNHSEDQSGLSELELTQIRLRQMLHDRSLTKKSMGSKFDEETYPPNNEIQNLRLKIKDLGGTRIG